MGLLSWCEGWRLDTGALVMGDIKTLSTVSKEPVQELVDALKKLLEQAEQGEIKSIAYAVIYDNEDVGHGWICLPSTTIIGELQILAHTLTAAKARETSPELFE